LKAFSLTQNGIADEFFPRRSPRPSRSEVLKYLKAVLLDRVRFLMNKADIERCVGKGRGSHEDLA